MKANKNVLAHAILLKVMGRLKVAKLNTDRDNSQRARLRRAKEEPVVEALRTATDAQHGRVIATTETTMNLLIHK